MGRPKGMAPILRASSLQAFENSSLLPPRPNSASKKGFILVTRIVARVSSRCCRQASSHTLSN